jgi:hypothetical protein
MNRTLSYGILALLISCTAQERSSQTADTLAAKTPIGSTDSINSIETSPTEESDGDCVFNNDYKGLTIEWLKELNITEFIWRDDLKQALVPKGQDTVFFSKGGCTHSGLLAELKLTNDDRTLTDSTYWVEKALALSVEYQFDHYEQMIRAGKIKKAESGETKIWYVIEDNDVDDNLIYNGIEITQDGKHKRINISQYFN